MLNDGKLTQANIRKSYAPKNYDAIINFLSDIPTYFPEDETFTHACYVAALNRITNHRGIGDAIHPILLSGLIAYSPRGKILCEAIALNIENMRGQEVDICLEIALQKYRDLAKHNCTEYKNFQEFIYTHKICAAIIETALKTKSQKL